jgi:hypothetical protein
VVLPGADLAVIVFEDENPIEKGVMKEREEVEERVEVA